MHRSHDQSRPSLRQSPGKRRPLSRGGCGTCKSGAPLPQSMALCLLTQNLHLRRIRHIKCDETKPKCFKCTSTGLVCDAYLPRHTIQLGLVPGLVRSEQEHHILQYFQERTIPELAKSSEFDFWNSLVLPASNAHVCILRAISALSCYQRNLELPDLNRCDTLQEKKCLFEYQSALVSLRETMSGESLEVVLTASIVLTCFDLMRKSYKNAALHFNHASKIAASSQARLTDVNGNRPSSHLLQALENVEWKFWLLQAQGELRPGEKIFHVVTFDRPASDVQVQLSCEFHRLLQNLNLMLEDYASSYQISPLEHQPQEMRTLFLDKTGRFLYALDNHLQAWLLVENLSIAKDILAMKANVTVLEVIVLSCLTLSDSSSHDYIGRFHRIFQSCRLALSYDLQLSPDKFPGPRFPSRQRHGHHIESTLPWLPMWARLVTPG